MNLRPNNINAVIFYQNIAAAHARHAINLLIFAQDAHDYNSRRGYEFEAIAYQQKAADVYRLARLHMRVEVA